ncbi:MAG: DNA alkylation repair protein [Fusobacteriaceae bacterium]
MKTNAIFEKFLDSANPKNAVIMEKYMRNHFKFLGIRTPERRALSKEFVKIKMKEESVDWNFVFKCFEKDEREFHLLGLDYLGKASKYLVREDILNLKKLILWNSWWDSVDTIAPIVGVLVKSYPELEQTFIEEAISAENFWVRRACIIYQLRYKKFTNIDILEKAILKNLGSREFFINKAIGWALREYSKTNRDWVYKFIETYKEQLSNLSIKEGSKYL